MMPKSSNISIDLLDLWLLRRRRCWRALAVHGVDDTSPLWSVCCPLRCFNDRCTMLTQSSRILSNHFFLGRLTGWVPWTLPCRRTYGYLSGPIHDICPKYRNCRCCNTAVISFFIPRSLFTSILHIRPCRICIVVIPQILRSTAISKTLYFRLCSSFIVHVSLLYNKVDCTKDWYSFTLVSVVISFDFQISSEFLTTPDAQTNPPRHILVSWRIRWYHATQVHKVVWLFQFFSGQFDVHFSLILANTLFFSFRVADFKTKSAASSMLAADLIDQILQIMFAFCQWLMSSANRTLGMFIPEMLAPAPHPCKVNATTTSSNMLNRSGDKMQPCNTPTVVSCQSVRPPSTLTAHSIPW